MKKNLKPQPILGAVPAVMVSCGNMEDSNIITIAWTGIISSEPPLVYVSIRPTRYSYNIIKESKEFVINIPNEKLVVEADLCGTKSGKEIDKFKEAKLTKEKAEVVKCPLIKECPINIECKVKEIKEMGSHDMFIGEIVNINVDDEYITENNKIDYIKARLINYLGNNYVLESNVIAQRGICLK